MSFRRLLPALLLLAGLSAPVTDAYPAQPSRPD